MSYTKEKAINRDRPGAALGVNVLSYFKNIQRTEGDRVQRTPRKYENNVLPSREYPQGERKITKQKFWS